MTVLRVDQGMAVAAHEALTAAGRVDDTLRTRYRQLRVMLHTAGLAATYAFIASKAGGQDSLARAYRAAGEGIVGRLKASSLLSADDGAGAGAILAGIGKLGPVDYARASAEAAAFAGWLTRLADAEWQDSGGGRA